MYAKPAKLTRRGPAYYLDFRYLNGKRKRVSAGKDKSYAETLLSKFNEWILAGYDPLERFNEMKRAAEGDSITLRQLYVPFMKRHGPNLSQKTRRGYAGYFKNICRCPELVDVPVYKLTKGLVLDYARVRMEKDNIKPGSVNREIALISSMLSQASGWGLIQANPILGIRKFKEAPKRQVVLTIEQAEALIESLPHPVDKIVEFAVYTGFRLENILSLKAEQITFAEDGTGLVSLVTKGNRRSVYPINVQAVCVVRASLGERRQGYVFRSPRTGTRYTTVRRTFNRHVKIVGLDNIVDGTRLRFHDLRHVFATWLYSRGVRLEDVRILMGHSDVSTTDRYTTYDIKEAGQNLRLMPRLRGGRNDNGPTKNT